MAGITALKRTGYLHGGVTHPDGRRGFFKGAEQDSKDKGTNISPGTVGSGPNKGSVRDFDTGPKDDLGTYNFDTSMPNPDGRPNYKQTLPKKKPPKTKDNYKSNFISDYFNYSIPTTIAKNITKSKFVTNLNAKKREKYIKDLLETDPDEYNRIMGDLSKINMIVGPEGVTTQVPPTMGFTQTDYGMPKAPPGMLTSNFEVIDGRKSLGDPAALEILGQKYKDTLTFDDNGGEGDNGYMGYPSYEAWLAAQQQYTPEEKVVEEKTIEPWDFTQQTGADVTQGYYAANGGRVPRAFGGIMDSATGRKAYGLGSLFKSVKKAASKVLKSPIGKAAMLYGLGAMGGSYGAGKGFFSKGMFNPANMGRGLLGMKGVGMDGGTQGLLNKLGLTQGYGSFLPTWKGGIAAMTALPLLGIGTEAKQDPSLMASRKDSRLIDPLTGEEGTPASMRKNIELAKLEAGDDPVKLDALNQAYNNMLFTTKPYENYGIYAANGGRIGFAFGGQPLPHDPTKPVNPWTPKPQGPVLPNRAGGYGKQRVMAEEGGLMNLGGMEKDYRAEGGFVPIGKEEKADDVPARLSVNEFVFTADAVRNAGGGDIDKGAEVMENMMKNLEKGGRISEESQGNTGAQEMFSVSERIGEVI